MGRGQAVPRRRVSDEVLESFGGNEMSYICRKCGNICDTWPQDDRCPNCELMELEEYIGENVEVYAEAIPITSSKDEEVVETIEGL